MVSPSTISLDTMLTCAPREWKNLLSLPTFLTANSRDARKFFHLRIGSGCGREMIGDGHACGASRRTAENAIRLLSILWLLLHFGLTAVYVMPTNPMNAAWRRLLDATVGTYYSQNWQLFSPEPLTENYALYILP
jgi:hypothetical protein